MPRHRTRARRRASARGGLTTQTDLDPCRRWRCGRLAARRPDDRCGCGHPGRVVKEIAGRTNQFITMRDGRRLFNLTTTLRLVRGFRTAQARRVADGEIELIFARDQGAAGDVAGQIVRVFRDRFGSNLEVRPGEVDQIVRSRRGKFMPIIDYGRGRIPGVWCEVWRGTGRRSAGVRLPEGPPRQRALSNEHVQRLREILGQQPPRRVHRQGQQEAICMVSRLAVKGIREMLEVRRREMPAELTQRIDSIKGRENVTLPALRRRVYPTEHASVETVRDEPGTNADVSPFVGGPRSKSSHQGEVFCRAQRRYEPDLPNAQTPPMR